MSKEVQFWSWFRNNQAKFTDRTQTNYWQYLDELLAQLHNYNENLFFEIQGHENQETKKLIITARGAKEYFNEAYQLVDAAPKIDHWEFKALKPPIEREDRAFITEYYGVQFDTGQLFFMPLENRANPELIGIRVLVNQLDESKYGIYQEGVMMIVQTILGEESAVNNIHYVEIVKNCDAAETIPLTELPEYVEWKKAQGKYKC